MRFAVLATAKFAATKFALFAPLALASSASAQIVIIDFDDLPGMGSPFGQGAAVPAQSLVSDQYAALGVTFDSGGGGVALTAAGNPVSPPNSVGATEIGPGLSFTDPVEAVFRLGGSDAVVDSASVTLSSSSSSSTLEAYSTGGLLLASDTGGASTTLTVAALGQIHRVVLRQGPMAFDDFTFSNLATVAPSFCVGIGCSCGNDDPESGCLNSTNRGSRLAVVSGNLGVAADNLVLQADWILPNQSGVLFASRNTTNVVFGDGLRCVGSPAVRYPVRVADGAGILQQGNVASLGAFAPGEIGYFQVWYRDPGGPCLTGFNLSSGLELAFTP